VAEEARERERGGRKESGEWRVKVEKNVVMRFVEGGDWELMLGGNLEAGLFVLFFIFLVSLECHRIVAFRHPLFRACLH
jgi:hypothetical protein